MGFADHATDRVVAAQTAGTVFGKEHFFTSG
jgi:hypothetical protein